MHQTIRDSIEQRIHAFLLDRFPLARKPGFSKYTELIEKGILDSLGILDVVSFLENEFLISIADDELVSENFHTLETLSSFVRLKLAAK
jgi:acyl carrier protein